MAFCSLHSRLFQNTEKGKVTTLPFFGRLIFHFLKNLFIKLEGYKYLNAVPPVLLPRTMNQNVYFC